MGDQIEDDLPPEDEQAKRKRERIERERAELLKGLAADDFSTLKNRVAAVLNVDPRARDSDIVLCLKYWEMFQPELYNPERIAPSDLFKLERLHYIVRARAMIQNEYGLFKASDAVRHHRKRNEETVKAEVLAEGPERSTIRIYADETGKNGRFVMVASVWVLTGVARFQLSSAVRRWREASGFGSREMHFATLGKSDANHLDGFLTAVLGVSEFIGFKVIAIERSRTRRSITNVVAKLHEHLLRRGLDHEVLSRRVSLPRQVEVTIDEEDSLDDIALAEMRDATQQYLRGRHGPDQLTIAALERGKSRHSEPLQLADIVAGAVNRLKNHEGERNFKDEYAEQIVNRLGISIEVGGDDNFDTSTMLKL